MTTKTPNLLAPMGQRVGRKIGRDEQRCSACEQIKQKTDFVTKCPQCKDCRNAAARRRRAERNGTAELVATVKCEPDERVCLTCKQAVHLDFFTPAGVKCEACRCKSKATSSKAWRDKNIDSERARGRAYKRRARCVILIKRVDENLALLAEEAERPSMTMTHSRELMWARFNLPTDMQQLAEFSDEEKVEALKWDADRDTRETLPPGLRAFFERRLIEFAGEMEERWADPVYVAAIHALWKKFFVTTEELEATRFNNDRELQAAKILDESIYEEGRAAMKERDRARGW
jgi:hypothetical protein